MYYKEATEAISTCLASNLENISVIDRAIMSLEQQSPEKIGTQRRIASNIDALETFQAMLDDIDFKGSTPSLGDHTPPRMNIQNVDVSVRPEIILSATGKSGAALVGAIKLHFSKTFPLDCRCWRVRFCNFAGICKSLFGKQRRWTWSIMLCD
jgi:hypothetical protein